MKQADEILAFLCEHWRGIRVHPLVTCRASPDCGNGLYLRNKEAAKALPSDTVLVTLPQRYWLDARVAAEWMPDALAQMLSPRLAVLLTVMLARTLFERVDAASEPEAHDETVPSPSGHNAPALHSSSSPSSTWATSLLSALTPALRTWVIYHMAELRSLRFDTPLFWETSSDDWDKDQASASTTTGDTESKSACDDFDRQDPFACRDFLLRGTQLDTSVRSKARMLERERQTLLDAWRRTFHGGEEDGVACNSAKQAGDSRSTWVQIAVPAESLNRLPTSIRKVISEMDSIDDWLSWSLMRWADACYWSRVVDVSSAEETFSSSSPSSSSSAESTSTESGSASASNLGTQLLPVIDICNHSDDYNAAWRVHWSDANECSSTSNSKFDCEQKHTNFSRAEIQLVWLGDAADIHDRKHQRQEKQPEARCLHPPLHSNDSDDSKNDGCQIFINYGNQKSNEEFLYLYGFIPRGARRADTSSGATPSLQQERSLISRDTVTLNLPAFDGDPLLDFKRAWMHHHLHMTVPRIQLSPRDLHPDYPASWLKDLCGSVCSDSEGSGDGDASVSVSASAASTASASKTIDPNDHAGGLKLRRLVAVMSLDESDLEIYHRERILKLREKERVSSAKEDSFASADAVLVEMKALESPDPATLEIDFDVLLSDMLKNWNGHLLSQMHWMRAMELLHAAFAGHLAALEQRGFPISLDDFESATGLGYQTCAGPDSATSQAMQADPTAGQAQWKAHIDAVNLYAVGQMGTLRAGIALLEEICASFDADQPM